MWDHLIHKWLRVPYTLNVHVDRKVKRPRATVVFLHGIGNSGAAWEAVINKLPKDLRVITIDLLGFGQSPKPHWPIYSARLQARSVIATFLQLRITGPVVLVGHSLGSLVAVETTKRYPLLVKSLVLCSPPFYKADTVAKKLLPHSDIILKDIYKAIQKRPDQFLKISALAVKYGIVSKSFSVTKDDIHTYMSALEATVVNQTSLDDAMKLTVPTQVLYGTLDPVVVTKNLKLLAKNNPSVRLTQVVAGHEVRALYIGAVVKAIEQAANGKKKNKPTS